MELKEILFNCFLMLVFFLIIFVVIYFINLWKFKNKKTIGEVKYLVNKFNLIEKKLKIRKMILWISIIDAFIIAFVGTFISILPVKFGWQFLIGFVLLVALIYSLFEIYGRHLVNKGYQKERNERK